MDAIITLLGLVIGTIIFFAVMQNVKAIVYNCSSVCITFAFCWGIGIVLAWVAWKIAIIIGIIALILFLVSKFTKPKKANSEQESTDAETNNTDSKKE